MQQYFVNGRAPQGIFQIKDKDTAKHMFSVMRLQADEQIVLVFDDGIKRLARVVDSQSQSVEIIEELADNVELPVSVTIAMGFPKGDKLEFVAQKATETVFNASGIDFDVLKASAIAYIHANVMVQKENSGQIDKKLSEKELPTS